MEAELNGLTLISSDDPDISLQKRRARAAQSIRNCGQASWIPQAVTLGRTESAVPRSSEADMRRKPVMDTPWAYSSAPELGNSKERYGPAALRSAAYEYIGVTAQHVTNSRHLPVWALKGRG